MATTKTSSIHARVDEQIRTKAEIILKSMGISISQYINMALYQVQIKQKIPFEIEAPSQFPPSLYVELDMAESERATTQYVPIHESYANMRAKLKESANA